MGENIVATAEGLEGANALLAEADAIPASSDETLTDANSEPVVVSSENEAPVEPTDEESGQRNE
jgi:hypothetical protein